jgi:transposase
MEQYIGLDVSLKDTSISVRQDGKRIWRGKCASDPKLLAEVIRKRAPHPKRVVFETAFIRLVLPRIDGRRVARDLPCQPIDMAPNKTDANDADGLAHLAEVGFYREVRVKGFDSMLIRTLVAGRRQLLKMQIQMSNQIRGLLKTFGLVIPKVSFDRNVRALLEDDAALARIILPLLQAWSEMRRQAAALNKQMVGLGRENQYCRLLMSVPGVGIVTATAFTAAVEDPANFKNSRSVGAWVGLTTKRYQSGEVDYDGHTPRRWPSRTLLYEAAAVK